MPQLDGATFNIMVNTIYYNFLICFFFILLILTIIRKNNFHKEYVTKKNNTSLISTYCLLICIYDILNKVLLSGILKKS